MKHNFSPEILMAALQATTQIELAKMGGSTINTNMNRTVRRSGSRHLGQYPTKKMICKQRNKKQHRLGRRNNRH